MHFQTLFVTILIARFPPPLPPPSQVLVHITDAHQVLTWDFDILRGDAVFSVLMSRRPLTVHKEPMGPMGPTNSVVLDKSHVCGVDYRVVELPLVCKAGASIQVGSGP